MSSRLSPGANWSRGRRAVSSTSVRASFRFRASTDSGHDVGLRLRPSRPTGLFGGMLSAPLVMPEVITGLSLLLLSGLGVDRECQIGKLLQRVGRCNVSANERLLCAWTGVLQERGTIGDEREAAALVLRSSVMQPRRNPRQQCGKEGGVSQAAARPRNGRPADSIESALPAPMPLPKRIGCRRVGEGDSTWGR